MQSTGHTSTHALSFTLMHGSAMMYGIAASQFSVSPAACSGWLNPWICTRIAAACQALGCCSEVREAGVERWAARDAVRPLRNAVARTLAQARRLLRAQAWVERVAQRDAEEVEREDRETDREPGADRHPRRRRGQRDGGTPQQAPPRGRRLRHPEAEKGERRLEEDCLPEVRGEHDQVRGHHVRQHVTENDSPVAEAGGARRVDVRHFPRSEEHTSELQSQSNLVCRLLLEKKKKKNKKHNEQI